MKRFLAALSFCVLSNLCSAQNAGPLAATLPNGRVVHFQSVEQKAKFEAARQRQTTVSVAPAAASTVVTPQQPASNAPVPMVTLEAKNSGGGAQYNYDWVSGYGSYDVTIHQMASVDAKVQNIGRTPADILVRACFIARSAKEDGRGILKVTEKPATLQPGQSTSLALGVGTTNRDMNLVMIQERYRTGLKYEGWVIQLIHVPTGSILKQTGSHSYLEDYAKTKEFTTDLADYAKWEKDHPISGVTTAANQ